MRDPELYLFEAEDLLHQRRLAEALTAFDLAEERGNDPDRCAGGRWAVHMLRGDFAAAWVQNDAIRERGRPDPHRFWNGEDFQGKRVIVRSLHGFGDAVQCLRYMSTLRRKASHVIVEVAPGLVELARAVPGVDEVITWGDAAPPIPPQWDVQMEITELPYVLRTEEHALPVATNYIQLPHTLVQRASLPFRKSGRPRVGLVWKAGEWDHSRSLSIDHLKTLARHGEIDFWNLQGGAARNEWEQLGNTLNLRDAPEFCADAGLLPLAAFLSNLDLIITVDTLAAHLGGALGIPTWVMLHHRADWRWMTGRDDSPWYPSLRLFRQATPGDWTGVLRQLNDALSQWADEQRIGRQVA